MSEIEHWKGNHADVVRRKREKDDIISELREALKGTTQILEFVAVASSFGHLGHLHLNHEFVLDKVNEAKRVLGED